jgi:hypothetical protein
MMDFGGLFVYFLNHELQKSVFILKSINLVFEDVEMLNQMGDIVLKMYFWSNLLGVPKKHD